MLDDYYTERVLSTRYKHFKNMEATFPQDGQLQDIIEYVKVLPSQDPPSIFGLHDNAEISSGMKETNEMLDYLISLQPRTGNSLGGGRDAVTKEACKGMYHILFKF